VRAAYLPMAMLGCATVLSAQDPFEIHVYEYEPMAWGEYSLEAHLNFMPQGAELANGTLLPTLHQTHLTLEPTVGVSPDFAVGFMFLSAWEPGSSPQFAGWRVLPHFYAPESWGLPVRLGFVAEFLIPEHGVRRELAKSGAAAYSRPRIQPLATGLQSRF
jgi:hypothetical protein